MSGAVPVIPRIRFTHSLTGAPVALGSVTVYAAGTTSLVTTYEDRDLTIESDNPVELDVNGEALFWVDAGATYKFLLKDALGVTIPGWPVDNIPGATDLATLTAALTVTINNAVAAAEDAQAGAEAARDAALAATRIYASTAAGLAAVANGEYFYVPSANDNESLILYKDNAGVALEVKRYPSKERLDAVVASTTRGNWFSDTFTEAGTTVLTSHISDSGHLWEFGAGNTTSPSVYTTFSGVVASGAAAAQIFRVSQIAPAADVKLTATFTFDSANYNNVGIAARLNEAGTAGYLAVHNRVSGHFQILRLGAALATTLLASSSFLTYGSGVSVAVEFSVANAGTGCVELSLTVAGTLVASATDTGGSIITAAGYTGLYFDTTVASNGVYIGSLAMAGTQQAEKPRVSFRAPYIDLADYDVDPTFTVDSTAGIQQAINDAFNRKIEKIKGMPGRFMIAGALVAASNSQLYIPYSATGNANRSIYIEGSGAPNFEQQGIVDVPPPTNGMIFESTIAGSGTNPAIIGGDPAGGGMTKTNFGMTHMGLRTRVSAGANSMSALNALNIAQLNLLDMVRIDTDMSLQTCPTPNSGSCGLIMPQDSNHAMLNVGAVYISGYYTGAVLTEHSRFTHLIVVGAVRGIRLDPTTHGSHIEMYTVEQCAYPIWIAGNHPLTICHYDTEHNINLAWATFVRDIHKAAGTRKIAILRSSVGNGVSGYDESVFASNDATIYKILVGAGAN